MFTKKFCSNYKSIIKNTVKNNLFSFINKNEKNIKIIQSEIFNETISNLSAAIILDEIKKNDQNLTKRKNNLINYLIQISFLKDKIFKYIYVPKRNVIYRK